jgi:hypothetical protein
MPIRHKTLTFYFQNAHFQNKICIWSVVFLEGIFKRQFSVNNYYFYFRPLTPAQVIKLSMFFLLDKELGDDEPIAMNQELINRFGVLIDD